jgi:phage head maturation protease
MNDDGLVVYDGGAVKTLASGRIGGVGIRFGHPRDVDSEREFFDRGTNYSLGGRKEIELYWEHGLDPQLPDPLTDVKLEITDVGIVVEGKSDMSDPNHRRIYNLAKSGDLGFSSGSTERLVRREAVGSVKRITRWPLAEISVVRRAAEPRNVVRALKSIEIHSLDEFEDDDIESQPPGVQQAYYQMKAIMINIRHQEAMASIKGWR